LAFVSDAAGYSSGSVPASTKKLDVLSVCRKWWRRKEKPPCTLKDRFSGLTMQSGFVAAPAQVSNRHLVGCQSEDQP
jgi:hypothetical protein